MNTEKILQELREWAETYPSYLSQRTPYAQGYKEGIVCAKEIVLEILNKIKTE